jgi:hypothetical protein
MAIARRTIGATIVIVVVVVIDMSSGQVRALGADVGATFMSPDGRWIYDPYWYGTGIRVLHSVTGQEVTKLLPDVQPYRMVTEVL